MKKKKKKKKRTLLELVGGAYNLKLRNRLDRAWRVLDMDIDLVDT